MIANAMNWDALVNLAALGIAAFALWLGHRERVAPYRLKVYEVQLQAYSDVLYSASRTVGLVLAWRATTTSELKTQLSTEIWNHIRESHELIVARGHLIPDSITQKLQQSLKMLDPELVKRDISDEQIAAPLFDAIDAVRTELNVEKLSKATRANVFGVSAESFK